MSNIFIKDIPAKEYKEFKKYLSENNLYIKDWFLEKLKEEIGVVKNFYGIDNLKTILQVNDKNIKSIKGDDSFYIFTAEPYFSYVYQNEYEDCETKHYPTEERFFLWEDNVYSVGDCEVMQEILENATQDNPIQKYLPEEKVLDMVLKEINNKESIKINEIKKHLIKWEGYENEPFRFYLFKNPDLIIPKEIWTI